MKQITCGLIIKNQHNEILMGKVTGQPVYDLPKGRMDDGETPEQTMLRETYEEFLYVPKSYQSLGEFPYNKEKRIFLFIEHVQKEDIFLDDLKCITFFEHHAMKTMIPEVDGYAWVPYSNIEELCSKSMFRVLSKQKHIFTESKPQNE